MGGGSRHQRFGETVVAAGYVDALVVNEALRIQRDRASVGESHKLLGLILLEMGAISSEQLIDTLQRMNGAGKLGAHAVDRRA